MTENTDRTYSTAILGFGNPARNDDGIGCRVAQTLSESLKKNDDILVLDMGISAFEVLFQLKRAKEIVLVDAVINSGKPPGTLFRAPAAEIESETDQKPMLFLHSLKWNQALYYAKNIMGEEYPADRITVYLIAVENIDFGETIQPMVIHAGDQLIEILEKQYGRS